MACVQWTFTGTSNVYRVGHKGKVDLKYIQEGQGGFYYRDHLGILGMSEDMIANIHSLANNTNLSTTNANPLINSVAMSSASLASSLMASTLIPVDSTVTSSLTTISTDAVASNVNMASTLVSNDHDTASSTIVIAPSGHSNYGSNISNPNAESSNLTSSINITSNDAVSVTNHSSSTSTTPPNQSAAAAVMNHMFSVGDKVKVSVTVEVFKQMQEGHGGWNQKMADLVGKIGTIHRVTEKGDIRVQYDGPENRWTIYPGALTKVLCTYLVGDYVRINNDEEAIKTLQKGHGEWTENMRAILGRICRIINVYADGDLRVSLNGTSFTLNPACCSSVPKHQADIHNTIAYHNMEDATLHMVTQFKDLLDDESIISVPGSPDQLVRESAHGHLQTIKDIIAKCPNVSV